MPTRICHVMDGRPQVVSAHGVVGRGSDLFELAGWYYSPSAYLLRSIAVMAVEELAA